MITRQDIVVGNTIQFLGMGQYKILEVDSSRKFMRIKERGSTTDQHYRMEEGFLSTWSVVERVPSLSINDIILNETYTDGTEKYRVVYKNSKCILAYTQDRVQEMPVLYIQDDISSWKKYVPPVTTQEYELVWSKGGRNSPNKIVLETIPFGNTPNAKPENILRREKIVYKSE